ncbi:conserved hypothetical protein [Alteromonas sp. 38]|uniref:FHA domain-containing protein n=1 Tax=Alteromonas TaxID=226 RepID=UPI0012F2CCAD|nr:MULTISPECIES: FHA domain-containing protein [Alteromonas]CAD5260319.1 conserved hypothetical protein [Alteromonas sp. 154]VXC32536.1 conserved hypothetical protein [Alteromonas sp. 38]
MAFATYTVGRSSQADICIADPSISRIHMEITVTNDGRYFCADRRSTHGTFCKKNGEWSPLKQGYIDGADSLVLGTKKIKLSSIINSPAVAGFLKQKEVNEDVEPMSFKPIRNTATGEIESSS